MGGIGPPSCRWRLARSTPARATSRASASSGRARDDNYWTLDGLDATGVKDPRQEAALRLVISTDSIAEFRVNSTLYSAESGGGAGAQVNIVSKSGSNEFHGSVFEFLRNDVLDARNPFDTTKQPFRLNQFGGNIGGPIVKNRTFFFANYEGLRQRVSQTFRNDVPSAAFRARATDPNIRPSWKPIPWATERTSNADVDRALGDVSQVWHENAVIAAGGPSVQRAVTPSSRATTSTMARSLLRAR